MFLCNKTYFNINSEIINDIDLPYNHFYLWWSMFVGCQTFSGSLRRNFKRLYIRSLGVHLWARVPHESQEHWSPANNDVSTVCVIENW